MNAFYLEKSLLGGEKIPIYYTPELKGGGIFWCQELINKKYYLPKVNSAMEMGCGAGFMGFYIKYLQKLKKLVLIDNYEPVTQVINRTVKENSWENEVELYISNGLDEYSSSRVDIVIANPPHLTSVDEFKKIKKLNPAADERTLLDEGLSLHTNFLGKLDKVLNPNGYVFLLENKIAIPPEVILGINPKLKLLDIIDHTPSMTYSALYQLT